MIPLKIVTLAPLTMGSSGDSEITNYSLVYLLVVNRIRLITAGYPVLHGIIKTGPETL